MDKWLCKLNFPNDHYTHDNTGIEWWYFHGKLSNEEFFHFATFRLKIGGFRTRATQWSIHNKASRYFEETSNDFGELKHGVTYVAKGNWFTMGCQHFFLRMTPNSPPMIHEANENRNYYSIPSLNGEGIWYPNEEIKSDVWMDHEFTSYNKFSNWNWIGLKLDCGLYIMAHNSETDKRCAVQFNDKTIKSDFTLEGKDLFIQSLGIQLRLEPTVEEKIFDPKFGISYSEQPFEVISNGKYIGNGMREKTYHKEH